MKRYRFGLGSVLRFRKVQEEQARAIMMEAQAEADRATAELEQRLEAIGASLPRPGRRLAAAFQDERDQLDRHMHALRAARSAEAHALASLLSARSEWEEAATRVRALERLDERHHERWVVESTRAAQMATDELAAIHHRSGDER
jgi:flagellar FliJ protein